MEIILNMRPRSAVLFTSGTNCDSETMAAVGMAGGQSELVHTSELRSQKFLDSYEVIIIPGGFSYGDHLGSATVWSHELRKIFEDGLRKFIDSDKLVLGICNGFQVLVKLGILPDTSGGMEVESVLANNSSGVFESRWSKLSVNKKNPCIFTKGIEILDLPVAHGEGRFLPRDVKVFDFMIRNNQIALQYSDYLKTPTMNYPENPNGSFASIAGISDRTGKVFGLMPHPERFLFPYQRPKKLQGGVTGLKVFKNMVDYFK